MTPLPLHEFHQQLGATFGEIGDIEVVEHYGSFLDEHRLLRNSAVVIDLSCRSRICLVGGDRQRFLNGQVTNDVAKLKTGDGCYAALVTAKGKMVSDLNIYALENELLLDFEPGLTSAITQRLDKYIIADDVQIVDVAPHYGLLSIQGPRAGDALQQMALVSALPAKERTHVSVKDETLGEIYIIRHARSGTQGFDLFVPQASLGAVFDKAIAAVRQAGGAICGWRALEAARLEAGIPRYGADMDETNLPPEAGIDPSAVSYTKGCYIGQEVIARIRTYGQVAKALRGLRLADNLSPLPVKGDKLLKDAKEVGYLTSVLASPLLNGNIALGYVRRETNQIGTTLILRSQSGETPATIVPLPFGTIQ
ncbi:MAG: aminomethyl transferase family protein [Pedosphaera sp.]|nr:aminomethyl transferase family protein [Pedosphaera sp.]